MIRPIWGCIPFWGRWTKTTGSLALEQPLQCGMHPYLGNDSHDHLKAVRINFRVILDRASVRSCLIERRANPMPEQTDTSLSPRPPLAIWRPISRFGRAGHALLRPQQDLRPGAADSDRRGRRRGRQPAGLVSGRFGHLLGRAPTHGPLRADGAGLGAWSRSSSTSTASCGAIWPKPCSMTCVWTPTITCSTWRWPTSKIAARAG